VKFNPNLEPECGIFFTRQEKLDSFDGIGTTFFMIWLKTKVESNFTCEQITDIGGIGINKKPHQGKETVYFAIEISAI